jgi:hypothetical protein
MDSKNYRIVVWPESQTYMGCKDAILINDEKGIEAYGNCAYFIPKDLVPKKYRFVRSYKKYEVYEIESPLSLDEIDELDYDSIASLGELVHEDYQNEQQEELCKADAKTYWM